MANTKSYSGYPQIKSLIFLLLICQFSLAQTPDFKAKGIVALSDADIVSATTSDGFLHKQIGLRDALTTINLPITNMGQDLGTSTVSNSSINSKNVLNISADGRFAFILETQGQFLDTSRYVKNIETFLPAGSKMYIADISNTAKPRTRFAVATGQYPTALDVWQNQVIIANKDTEKPIQLVEIDMLGHPVRNVFATAKLPENKFLKSIHWHTSGEFVAVIYDNMVALLKAKRHPDTKKIIDFQWFGKPQFVGENPVKGHFTPDSKSFIINDYKNTNTKSELSVWQLNTYDSLSSHKFVSKIAVGLHTEDFAISPQGDKIVAISSQKTHFPWNDPSFSSKSLLTLFSFSNNTLSLISEQEFDGIMPKSVIFDQDGNNVAVSVFEYYDLGRRNGGVEFWKIKPTLTKQPLKINVMRGCHALQMLK